MPFPELSSYEILSVSTSASMEEIMKAYQKALQERRFPPEQISQAFNELRNPQKRAEYEFLIRCHLRGEREVREIMAGLPEPDFISDAPPVKISPLAMQSNDRDFGEIPDHKMELATVNFDDAAAAMIPPVKLPS